MVFFLLTFVNCSTTKSSKVSWFFCLPCCMSKIFFEKKLWLESSGTPQLFWIAISKGLLFFNLLIVYFLDPCSCLEGPVISGRVLWIRICSSVLSSLRLSLCPDSFLGIGWLVLSETYMVLGAHLGMFMAARFFWKILTW